MNTAELLGRLERHYIKPGEPLPGGVFLPEVGWNGQGGFRRCDALYVGFTSTSGRILVGHELKVSRADWLHELDQMDKADQWADECHEWWLVVGDPAIVHPGELPAGWGLMSPGKSKTRMQLHHKPDRKPATHRPGWHAVRSLIARQDTLRARAISDIKMAARDEAQADLKRQVDAGVALRLHNQPETAELERRIKLIETALGGQIDWDAEERGYIMHGPEWVGLAELELIASAVRATGDVHEACQMLSGRYTHPGQMVRRSLRQSLDRLDELDAALELLRTAAKPKEAQR
ncbi:Gp62 [uncultured Mycobacterium sp.]|uniref:Gp62 n=1 Tax=uncultured Mycobacterium sp. TaxID=171292 RepID=A0A1Y5PD57_9MYCO|nr:Gp62 [uncultured Mycobacterium sp.]